MSEVWVAAFAALWVVVLFMMFLLAGALRQIGILELRLGEDPGALITAKGLDRGSPAPDIAGQDAESGDQLRLSQFPSKARVLVFLSTTCLSCEQLVPHLNEVARTRGAEFDWLVICQGSRDECRAFRTTTKLQLQVLVDESRQAESDYDVALTPFAYLLDWEGRVVIRGVVNNWQQLESLLEQEGTLEPSGATSA